MTDAKKPQEGEGDLAILFPNVTTTIDGVSVTVREYGFEESMRLNALFAPICDGLAAAVADGDLADPALLDAVFADNTSSVIELIAAACNQPREWVAGLGDEDGQNLRLLWWSVNAGFFGRRVAARIVSRQMTASAGQTSLPSSSKPATASGSLGNTPGAN